MPLKLNKNTDNIIFYSVLIAGYEELNFKNDALAGVRANYFNSDCSAQREATDVLIDSQMYNLSYNMENNAPLIWKVTRNNRPYQSVKHETDGFYCVLYYSASGAIYKRIYFDNEHTWVKTEYYVNSVKPICRISPYFKNDTAGLKLEENLFTQQEKTLFLSPAPSAPSTKCAALAYTNCGMIYFEVSYNDISENQNIDDESQKRFGFTEKSFDYKEISNFDITKSVYLDDELNTKGNEIEEFQSDIETEDIAEEDVTKEDITKENTAKQGYSAYDMIQNILFEAHKSNKNLFGDVIDIQNALEFDEKDKNDCESNLEIGKEEEIDSTIATASGKYMYYGSLDESGNRSGKGRTVTPDGVTAYEGYYKNNLKDGFGVGYYKTGEINYVGSWIQNNRSGAGVGYRLSDGTMHAGKWIENKPEGYGARFDKEGNFLDVCNYNNGLRNGKSVSLDEDGNIVVSFWENGELIFEKLIRDGDLIE